MIILTATTLGPTVGLMRSASVIALVAMLIGATLLSPQSLPGGAVSFLALLYTIIGYKSMPVCCFISVVSSPPIVCEPYSSIPER